MFAKLSRSWEFAKISYGILWDFKSLILFPILSTLAAGLVLASFLLPLWSTGMLDRWMGSEHSGRASSDPIMWVVLFLFYFCSYFVIIFFNVALASCALRVVEEGKAPTLGYGLSAAAGRLPQIAGWAAFSAVIGLLLKVVENVHEKAGQWIASLLGSAWTALTYFVVPVIVVEGPGPVAAFKRSVQVLKLTWGEGLIGNFSMGMLSALVMLPLMLLIGVGLFMAIASGSLAVLVLVGVTGAVLMFLAISASSAADIIFKAVLYNYATGKTLPESIDTSVLSDAFVAKK